MPRTPRSCDRCGKPIIRPTGRTQKWCNRCRHFHKKERAAQWHAVWYAKNRERRQAEERARISAKRSNDDFRNAENAEQRSRMQQLRDRRYSQGKCRLCEARVIKGKRYCREHIEYVRRDSRERKQRARLNPVKPSAPHPNAPHDSLRPSD